VSLTGRDVAGASSKRQIVPRMFRIMANSLWLPVLVRPFGPAATGQFARFGGVPITVIARRELPARIA
jgi:hypothetical protein